MNRIPFLPRCTLVLWAAIVLIPAARSAPPLAQVPDYQVRVRVLSLNGQSVTDTQKFTLAISTGTNAVEFAGGDWSPWLGSTRDGLQKALASYPNSYNSVWQVTTGGTITPKGAAIQSLKLEVQTAIAGAETNSTPANLFGPNLGVILWKGDDGQIHVDTFTGHGRRVYDKMLQDAALPAKDRPKRIVFADRFIGADSDRIGWEEGLTRLSGLGMNAIHGVPEQLTEVAKKSGLTKVWGAIYNPPGYAYNFSTNRQEVFKKFVDDQVAAVLKAGWKKEEIGLWVTSDEPGWYYPTVYRDLNTNTLAMAAFHDYLQKQGLKPASFGQKNWDDVKLIGRREYTDLPTRRQFYWSNRFVPWASSVFFSEVARAYEAGIYPRVPVLVNFNNFMGCLYEPGPVANNPDKKDTNAGMGQHDWLEFGRVRGITCLATEDWFGDAQAAQWSYYATKLRSAAEFTDAGFGALVIPRVGGQRPEGMSQKLLALIGHGSKTLHFFVFGPEYAFPGNCYSENLKVYKPLADAIRLTARAEDLLYPGRPRPPEVAILTPQSSQLWDLEDQDLPHMIDATNNSMDRGRMTYMAEMYALFLALQHQAVPVQFVDELGLTEKTMARYKVLYVTAPDLPAEAADALLRWVKAGGTLVTVAGTGLFDRYHQPLPAFTKAVGVSVAKPVRELIRNLDSVGANSELQDGDKKLAVFGPREGLTATGAKVLSLFADGAPAMAERTLGKGRIIRFACFPGLSYRKSATGTTGGLASGFSADWRRLIAAPVTDAKVRLPVTVNRPMIEVPALYSDAGVAVTLLNWSGVRQEKVEVRVQTDRPVARVESARGASVKYQPSAATGQGQPRPVDVTLDVGDADVLLLRY